MRKREPPELKYPTPLRVFFRNAMIKANMSSEDLADILYVSRSTVNLKFAKAHWTEEDLRTWCEALNITDAKALGEAILSREVLQ